jgi:Flp pilus assembly pilin Flp
VKDAAGATAMEYALVGTLVSIVILTAVTNMGTSMATFYQSIANGFASP